MDVKDLKQSVYESNKLQFVLEELGMHHISWHNGNEYVTCGMPDGDNTHSTIIYNNPTLNVVAYTRNITDAYGVSDIISLICFIKKIYFSNAVRWLCDFIGVDYYYQKPKPKDKLIQYLLDVKAILKKGEVEEPPLTPIPERTLSAYVRSSHQDFVDDNISDQTQYDFEIGYSYQEDLNGYPRHRITIPIRDENGVLVGVKGRLPTHVDYNRKIVDEERKKQEPKYIYLIPCAKSQILYGLYKTQPYIQEKDEVIICESEKGVMQLWTYGVKNAVGVGGHQLSPVQKEKIVRLGVEVTIAFDKDVTEDEVRKTCKELSPLCKKVSYIIDEGNLLKEKESPMDDPDKWSILYSKKYLYIS